MNIINKFRRKNRIKSFYYGLKKRMPGYLFKTIVIIFAFCFAISQIMLVSAFEAHIINVTADIINGNPRVTPSSGYLCNSEEIEISISTVFPDAYIVYTLNDTEPDCFATSTLYTDPFYINETKTLKTIACYNGKQSEVVAETYVFDLKYCICGDGVLDEGEECDDGNNIDGDGCDADCTIPRCAEWVDIDFEDLVAGTDAREQYASLGVHIEAINHNTNHPDKAIIFDSANPTGGDLDLITPGYGPNNTEAQSKILIIAENDIDVSPPDGIVDNPDDEARGGTIIFTFDTPTIFEKIGLLDIEKYEVGGYITLYNTGDAEISDTLINGFGDNSFQTMDFGEPEVKRAEIELAGSGAITGLRVCKIGSFPYCGDGKLDPGEECDDGNNEDGDGCSTTCGAEDVCILEITKSDAGYDPISPGKNIIYHLTLENTGSANCTGGGVKLYDTYDQNTSYISAVPPPVTVNDAYIKWNFGTVEPGEKHEVDLAMHVSRDTPCDSILINKIKYWSNQTGYGPEVIEETSVVCESTNPYCGDGNLDPDEECDDGNNIDGDGCSAICAIENPECGECDGKVSALTLKYSGSGSDLILIKQKRGKVAFNDTVVGGETFSFVGANKKGTLSPEISIFINGVLNTKIHTSCSRPIYIGLVSGNFTIIAGESRNGGAFCPPESCCGDGTVDFGEECDGINGVGDNQECDDNCLLIDIPYCGNGDLDPGEECDDGNIENNDGCSSVCIIEKTEEKEDKEDEEEEEKKEEEVGEEPVCGDGIVDFGEECDGINGVGDNQECDDSCLLVDIPYCGNGDLDPGEECDDGNNEDGDGCDVACMFEIIDESET